MTTALEDAGLFISLIETKPRLDILTNDAIVSMRATDFDEVFLRACKVIPSMMYTEFSRYTRDEIFLDLMQAAALGVLRAVERWDPEGGSSLTTWAYRLARQEVLKELERDGRWQSRHELVDFEDFFDDENEGMLQKNDTFDEAQGYGERAMEWYADYFLVRQILKPQYQCILDLLKEGYTQREIAEELDMAQPTVSRAVAEIQQEIEYYLESNSDLEDIT